MTKASYFEMCEVLGEEPIEEEIPVDPEDLPVLVQQCFSVYNMLEDNWDSMGGSFLGKNYSTVFKFFELYQIPTEEVLLALTFMQQLDSVRSKLIAEKIKAKSSTTK